MKVLIAPDKFKGSLSSDRVASAIAQGLYQSGKEFCCIEMPLADGGEGTSKILTKAAGGNTISLKVGDPLGRTIETHYGISRAETTAFIEMSGASGLSCLQLSERNPLQTSSRGTGQVMRDAVSRNVNQIILGIGGTATHDGGMGIADAFGVRFLDASGRVLAPVGENLPLVSTVNLENLHSGVESVKITVLNDVQNPLCGPHGAASVFASQKGAAPDQIKFLDDGLFHFAQVLHHRFHSSPDFPGAGAGGGVGAVLKTFFKAKFESGIRYVMDSLRVEEHISAVDVVITGEGSLDTQTLQGKVVSGLAEICRRYSKPLYVISGKNELTRNQFAALGIRDVFPLASNPETEREAMQNAFEAITQCAQFRAPEIAASNLL
jgi:glycerate 2-kinase